jgi:hypothetical protein
LEDDMATYPVLEIAAHYDLGGVQDAVNVLHVEATYTLDLTTATVLTDIFVDAWNAHLESVINDEITLTDMVVTDLRTVGGPQFTVAYNTPGTSGTDALPWTTAALITWNTALRSRSTRGRTYLVGFVEGGSSGQNMTDTLFTHIGDFAQALVDGYGGALAVLSKKNGTSEPITSFTLRKPWKRMSRRRLGG